MTPARSTPAPLAPQRGRPPSLEQRLVDELGIDSTYQRAIDTGDATKLIRKIASGWDWTLCQPLVVARRPDGSLWVVDGQHRLAAARLRGDIQYLPCVVISSAAAGEEAQTFVALNANRRPLNAVDLFKAALAAEDPAAVEVARLMTMASLRLAPHSNFARWKPGMLYNIHSIRRFHARWGAQKTAIALTSLSAAFRDQVLRHAGGMFDAIAGLVGPGIAPGEFLPAAPVDQGRLTRVLQTRSQEAWISAFHDRKAQLRTSTLVASVAVLRLAYGVQPPTEKLGGGGALPAGTAPVVPPPSPAPRAGKPMTFEEQLERVRNGAPIATKLVVRKPDPETCTGSSLA